MAAQFCRKISPPAHLTDSELASARRATHYWIVYRYYSDKLAAERLRRCYDIAPPRVQQYLQAEIDHVLSFVSPESTVLELGCGHGRVLGPLAAKSDFVIGIDTSVDSLTMARDTFGNSSRIGLAQMDAANTAFADGSFDLVVCIQNGISAFHVDQRRLIEEALRITRPSGTALFSTYAEKFWDDRLEWFELQADAGLLGEIDHDATGDGEIVCKDGFRATTVSPEEFAQLTHGIDATVSLVEVDGSSLFCEMRKGQ